MPKKKKKKKTTKRIDYRCPVCGSREVCVDACARWDIPQQAFKLSGTHDGMTCQDCGYDALGNHFEKEI